MKCMEVHLNFTYLNLTGDISPTCTFTAVLDRAGEPDLESELQTSSIWTPRGPSLTGNFGHLKEEKCTVREKLPRYCCKWYYESLNQNGTWKSLMMAANPPKKDYITLALDCPVIFHQALMFLPFSPIVKIR